MAGIFSIFSEPESSSSISSKNGKEKMLAAKSRSIGGVGLTPSKSFIQPQIKPKGLSIRSKSDLNVSVSSHAGISKLNSKECLKLDSQCTPNKPSVSPIKLKTPKSKSCNVGSKKLSPKMSSPIMQNVVDDYVFAKPATPRGSTKLKMYPEPEKLACYFNPVDEMNEEMETIFEADRKWIRSAMNSHANQWNDSMISLEDEGFISDPEQDSLEIQISSPLPSLGLSDDIELPDISDCED